MLVIQFMMSLVVIVIGAHYSGKLAEKFKLPGLLGMMAFGLIIGPNIFAILPTVTLNQASFFKDTALVIVLFIAGLGISWQQMQKIGRPAVLLSSIPAIFEGFTIAVVAMWLFDFDFIQGAILGFIIAAVSPAVLIPSMIDLVNRRLGEKKAIPQMLLVGASADDTIAITFFTLFLTLYTQRAQGIQVSPIGQVIQIPLMLVVTIVVAWSAAKLLHPILKKMQHPIALVGMTFAIAYVMRLIETVGQVPLFNSLLAIMMFGFFLRFDFEAKAILVQVQMQRLWKYGRSFLFVFVGAAINPLLVGDYFLLGVVMLAISLTMRSIGVWIALLGTNLTWQERCFCIVAYLPKATVQSAKAGVPLEYGVAGGEIIQALAILSVLITAPIGAIGIQYFAPRILMPADDESE
ncbi:MAG: cation:proton antiporter [Culicoidibacterales bacterium]